jgi:hypothetical protein
MTRFSRKLIVLLILALALAGQVGARSTSSSTPVDGVYRVRTTPTDLRAIGTPQGDITAANYGTFSYVFDRGRFAFTQESKGTCTWGYGRIRVNGHQMAWTFTDGGGIGTTAVNKPGEFFRFGWSLYHGILKLTAVKGAVSPEPVRAKPWRLVNKTPSRRYFSKRCPPPAQALAG